MLRRYLDDLAALGIAFDTETWLIQWGNLAPPLVCGSVGAMGPDGVEGALLDKDQCLEVFRQILSDKVMITANGAFDLLVVAMEFAKRGIDVMPEIFRALSEGRMFDIQIAQALDAVANGCLGMDPRTGAPLVNPETGRRGRYSLSTCVDLTLGRRDAKANDEWRLRYHELDGVPLSEWPPAAKQYPVDDSVNTCQVGLAHAGIIPRVVPYHQWQEDGTCADCGARKMSDVCMVRRPLRNLHDLSNQVAAHFALHLGAAWGFRVDQSKVDVIERHALRNRERSIVPFVESGLVRADGTEDRSQLKRRIAEAYGASQPCPVCSGTGKVISPKAPLVRCPTCRGATFVVCDDPRCKEGKIPSPRALINCFAAGEDGATVKTCDGTGLLLDGNVPRSDKEGISYGRDTMGESGDEYLMSYASHLDDAKTLNVYVPYLRGTDKVGVTHPNAPLTLRPNVLLETGRTSYDGVIQLFPRKSGHKDKESGKYIPSLRECITARPGWFFSSSDYEAGELVTHAQSTLWITGFSEMAKAMNAGLKVHNALAATMIGMSYDNFQMCLKETRCINARQAAKPGNFGFPGGMGPVKMVHQQRKQGPDTVHPSGPTLVLDDNKDLVPGYKGLRFCLLMDNASACGIEKVREWRDRPIAPTCLACIKCAVRLKDYWLRQWPENRPYLSYVNDCVENGMVITAEALARWSHLQEVFTAGQRLAPGEIMQHVSGRIRGGIEYSSGANGFFQASLSEIGKSALVTASRECYDRTIRLTSGNYAGGSSPLFGSRIVVFQHDEILAEHPESVAHDAAMRISEIMVQSMKDHCPDLAPSARVDPCLMRCWYKGATASYNKDRKLIPWQPNAY